MAKIHQEVTFNASPSRVYKAFMDSKEHAKFTGAPATISTSNGGAFSCHDGKVTGINVSLTPGKRIVQAWRVEGWPEDVYSLVTFSLQAQGSMTRLLLDHDAIPDGTQEHLEHGWKAMYWEPMARYLGA